MQLFFHTLMLSLIESYLTPGDPSLPCMLECRSIFCRKVNMWISIIYLWRCCISLSHQILFYYKREII